MGTIPKNITPEPDSLWLEKIRARSWYELFITCILMDNQFQKVFSLFAGLQVRCVHPLDRCSIRLYYGSG